MSKTIVNNVSVHSVEKKPTEPGLVELVKNARTSLARLEAYASFALSAGAANKSVLGDGGEAARVVSGAVWRLIERLEREETAAFAQAVMDAFADEPLPLLVSSKRFSKKVAAAKKASK